MGYGDEQRGELQATIQAADCDVVVAGTPMDLGRIIDPGHPLRRVSYELREIGPQTLEGLLAPIVQKARP
jgi:predicted GTPase